MPATSAAAAPPLDPPADRDSSSGLRTGPNADSSLVVPNANSCRLVLPIRMAPASRSRCTTGASAGASARRHRRPGRRRVPATSIRSLTDDRDAVQRAAVAAGPDLLLGRARASASAPSRITRDEGVDSGPRVDRGRDSRGRDRPATARPPGASGATSRIVRRSRHVSVPCGSGVRVRRRRPRGAAHSSASRSARGRSREVSSSGFSSGSPRARRRRSRPPASQTMSMIRSSACRAA